MWKTRLKRFLGLQGNRQLVLTMSSAASILAVTGFVVSFNADRSSRLHAEEHALEITTLLDTKTELAARKTELQSQVTDQRAAFVSVNEADLFRDQIIALVRETNCRLRSVHPGEQDSRRWMQKDSLLTGDELFDGRTEEPIRTPFELITQSVSLQVTGAFEDTQTLLRKIQALNKTVTTRTLAMQVVPEQGIQLDWDLLYFDLHPVAIRGDEW